MPDNGESEYRVQHCDTIAAARSFDSSSQSERGATNQKHNLGPRFFSSFPNMHAESSTAQMPATTAKKRCSSRTNCQVKTTKRALSGISELISAGYLDLGVASIQLRPHRNASVISNMIDWVCQTQEQANRGPFTQPKPHLWDKRSFPTQRQRFVGTSFVFKLIVG